MPSVQLSEETVERLDYVRREGESYDDVVSMLLDHSEGEAVVRFDSEDV